MQAPLMPRRPHAVLALGCALTLSLSLALPACTTAVPEADVIRHRNAQVQEYVIPGIVEETWNGMRKVLMKHGYELGPVPEGDFVASTPWKDEPGGRGRTRYHVQLLPTGMGRSKVTMTRETEAPQGGGGAAGSQRDLALEFELIEQLWPEQAVQIEAEAKKEAMKEAKARGGCSLLSR